MAAITRSMRSRSARSSTRILLVFMMFASAGILTGRKESSQGECQLHDGPDRMGIVHETKWTVCVLSVVWLCSG